MQEVITVVPAILEAADKLFIIQGSIDTKSIQFDIAAVTASLRLIPSLVVVPVNIINPHGTADCYRPQMYAFLRYRGLSRLAVCRLFQGFCGGKFGVGLFQLAGKRFDLLGEFRDRLLIRTG